MMLKASLMPILVKTAKFDSFSTEIVKFFVFFSKISSTKGFVPDIVGLLERFFSIPSGRIRFYKTFTVKIGKIEI